MVPESMANQSKGELNLFTSKSLVSKELGVRRAYEMYHQVSEEPYIINTNGWFDEKEISLFFCFFMSQEIYLENL